MLEKHLEGFARAEEHAGKDKNSHMYQHTIALLTDIIHLKF